MKVYIAGKITGLTRTEVQEKFARASIELQAQGHETFVPCVLPDYADIPHQDYLHVCYAMIDICEAVYMLSDWQMSPGARMELQYAADYQKKILYEDEATREADFPISYGHPKTPFTEILKTGTENV